MTRRSRTSTNQIGFTDQEVSGRAGLLTLAGLLHWHGFGQLLAGVLPHRRRSKRAIPVADFALPKLCLEKFWSTEAALGLAILSYNLLQLFQRHLGWLDRTTAATLRFRLFITGSIISETGAVPRFVWRFVSRRNGRGGEDFWRRPSR